MRVYKKYETTRRVVDRTVIVPHNFHLLKNGWLKCDHRVMYKKYTTPCPPMVCGVGEIHLEMAQPTKKEKKYETDLGRMSSKGSKTIHSLAV